MLRLGVTRSPAGDSVGRIARWASSLFLGALILQTLVLLVLPTTAHAAAHPSGTTIADCSTCHAPHQARMDRSLLSVSGSLVATATTLTESLVCYTCHGDSGGSDWNIQSGRPATGGINSFSGSMTSGHELEDSDTPTDLTNSCTSCHGVHGDPGLAANLPSNEQVAGIDVDPTNPRSWCLACHSAEHAWVAGYPVNATLRDAYEVLVTAPSRDTTTKYVTKGTFPGGDHYATSTHAAIDAGTVQSLVSGAVTPENVSRVAGDCLWCHTSHGSPAAWDGLLAEYRASTDDDLPGGATPGEYAQACFECHGNSTGDVYKPSVTYTDAYWETTAGAPDIYTLVTAAGSTRSGHRVRTTGAGVYYEPGSPLPCYECHNPHGSKNGNTLMISDALGGNLHPDGTAAQVRQFCFSCHTTGDTTPAGWDSDANNDGTHTDGAYTTTLANTAVGATVIGISRTAAPPTSYLRLTGSSFHLQSSSLDCLSCHASAHRPTGGVSEGGIACYGCHRSDTASADYEKNMEYDGANKGDNYHHVMGTATTSGDTAFAPSAYPAAGTDVYCLSCHVDHDKFNASQSSSLRSAIGPTAGAATASNTDFTAATGGVCLGCHFVSRTKGADQKSDGTSATPAIPYTRTDAIAAGGVYDASEHQYQVAGRQRGDSTTFAGNCSKCHSDRVAGIYYKTATTGAEFGLHYDPSRRILEALGRGSVPDPYAEERFCYSCHSTTAAGFKPTANRDWYNDADGVMDSAAEGVYTQITASADKHTQTLSSTAHRPAMADEVSGNRFTASEHVECADCHSPHAAGEATASGTIRTGTPSNLIGADSPIAGVWGVAIGSTAEWGEPTYSTLSPATREYQICLKCHSGFNSSYTPDSPHTSSGTFSWSTAGGWTNVALEFNPANDSYHPVFAAPKRAITQTMISPWNANRGSQTMYCSDCHMDSASSPVAMGPHGSATTHILRGTWNPTSSATGYTLNSLGASFLCSKCHVLPGTNVAHARGNHQGYSCGSCHIAVPHGGAAPRLLATNGTNGGKATPAPYNAGTYLVSFGLPASGSGRTNANCQAAATPCGAHSTATTNRFYWNW